MENIKINIAKNENGNFLSLTADITEAEADRLTTENCMFLGQTETSGLGLICIPILELNHGDIR